ncbi:hypothetical protein E6H36_08350 [Candidatus Bathyarchaeota archaeon]|nr:MAG: hypothetical protein E6H36_08350 [Candidatus Bathyarchaeota archaeon]TMI29140.1 MAG: hypothetical protein E6H29_11920 [Candidatus Bathyarchaeota archaeon]
MPWIFSVQVIALNCPTKLRTYTVLTLETWAVRVDLPEEFRRRIEGIPIGNILEVVTRDPSAKEDLPSLVS